MTFPEGPFGSTEGEEASDGKPPVGDRDGDLASDAQRRQCPRRLTTARCWISDEVHTAYLRMHDISLGGLSVGAPLPFSPDSEIEVRIELPFGREVRARGKVVWRKDMRLGARFVEILAGQTELDELCMDGPR